MTQDIERRATAWMEEYEEETAHWWYKQAHPIITGLLAALRECKQDLAAMTEENRDLKLSNESLTENYEAIRVFANELDLEINTIRQQTAEEILGLIGQYDQWGDLEIISDAIRAEFGGKG